MLAKRHQLFLGLIIILWISCNNVDRRVESSFYYWKQSFDLTNSEQTYLKELEVKKIYIKFFDIKWNKVTKKPFLVAPISFKTSPPQFIKIIPTIYITNSTVSSCSETQIDELADFIINNIKKAALSQNISTNGIQIDCDWSLSTKDKYFHLLKSIRNSMPKEELSATIRLHQVKFYKKTGIPPVDRGTLMFYNMDAVTDSLTTNSILDLKIAKQYFYNFDEYTIPLDVALPLFKWGVVQRRGKVVQLINHLDTQLLTDEQRFKKVKKHHYNVLESHYLNGFYIYKNDQIRLESVSKEILEQSAQLLNQQIQRDTLLNVTYYHLDSTVLENFSIQNIQAINNQF
jgi:hypothetical protein